MAKQAGIDEWHAMNKGAPTQPSPEAMRDHALATGANFPKPPPAPTTLPGAPAQGNFAMQTPYGSVSAKPALPAATMPKLTAGGPVNPMTGAPKGLSTAVPPAAATGMQGAADSLSKATAAAPKTVRNPNVTAPIAPKS